MAAYSKNTPGAPTSGVYAIGDIVTDSVGIQWKCIQAGPIYPWHGQYFVAVDAKGTDGNPNVSVEVTIGDVTIPAAMVANGLWRRDPNGASRSDSLPTFADMRSVFGKLLPGMTFRFVVANIADAAETISLGGNGWASRNQGSAASNQIGQDETKEVVMVVQTSADTDPVISDAGHFWFA